MGLARILLLLALLPPIVTTKDLHYIGCFKDGDPRDLPQRVHARHLNAHNCVKQCKNLEYKYAGLQFSYLCFCGNTYGRYGDLPESSCSSECKSKRDSFCGGHWSNSVYKTGFEPSLRKTAKKANKHVKRDEVVMFDNIKHYNHKPEDRTLTIDVNPAEYSYIPKPEDIPRKRTQRSATDDTQYYDIGNTNQQYGQKNNVYGNIADTRYYNNGDINQQYGTTPAGNNRDKSYYNVGETNQQQATTNLVNNAETRYYSVGDVNQTYGATNTANTGATKVYNIEDIVSNTAGQGVDAYNTNSTYTSSQQNNETWPSNNASSVPGSYAVANASNGNSTYPYPSWENNQTSVYSQGGYYQGQQNVTEYPLGNVSMSAGSAQNATYPFPSWENNQTSVTTLGGNLPEQQNTTQSLWNNGSNATGPAENASYPYPSWESNQTSVASQGGYYPEQLNATQYPLNNESSFVGSPGWPLSQEQTAYNNNTSFYNQTTEQGYYNNGTFEPQNALNQSSSSYSGYFPSAYGSNSTNFTESGSNNSLNTTQYADLQSAGYTYSAQALAPAQTPNSAPGPASYPAPAPYPAYAPYPAPYPATYPAPSYAPNPAPYPAPSYTPYPAPSPSYSPYPSPSPAPYPPYSLPVPAPVTPSNDKKTPCQLERQMAKTMDDAFVPECKQDGSYSEMQCFEHAGFAKQCWCVTNDGQEVHGTRMTDGQMPKCTSAQHDNTAQNQTTTEIVFHELKNITQPEKPKTQCQKERQIALSPFITDIFVPLCDAEGNFVPLQCFEHDVYGKQCWCVDSSGHEIRGSRISNGTKPDCGVTQATVVEVPSCNLGPYGCCHDNVTFAKGPDMEGCPPFTSYETVKNVQPAHLPIQQLTKCQQEQFNATKSGAADIFVPICEPSGQYKEIQCYTFPASGKTDCWCVDQNTGIEIPGSRVTGKRPDCRAPVTFPPTNATTPTTVPTTQPTPPSAYHVYCEVTIYGCCPDNKTAASGPNYNGCQLPQPPPPFRPHPQPKPKAKPMPQPRPTTPVETPTFPAGFTKDVCVSLMLAQVWYNELAEQSPQARNELNDDMVNAVTKVYRAVHPDFTGVRLTSIKKASNPYVPNGPSIINVYLVISFRKPVADPLATLRDHIITKKKLGSRQVMSKPLYLKNIVPFDANCLPNGKKPVPVAKPQPLLPPPRPVKPPVPHPPHRQPSLPHPAPVIAVPAPPVAALLAVHIPFDRYFGVSVLDTSKKANNGLLNNVEIAHQPDACGLVGIFSKGNVSFNGRKFFPKPSVAVTIAMWVKLSSTVGRQSLFNTVGETSLQHQGNYHFEVIDGKVRWFHRDLKGNVVFNITTSLAVVPQDRWTHLVGTYDKQEGLARLYVNTQMATQGRASGYLSQDWGETAGIGSHKGERFLVGAVDEFYIYTSALSQGQIRELACVCEDSKGIHVPKPGSWPQCMRGNNGTIATSKVTPLIQPPCVPCVIPPQCPVPHPCPTQCPAPCPPITPTTLTTASPTMPTTASPTMPTTASPATTPTTASPATTPTTASPATTPTTATTAPPSTSVTSGTLPPSTTTGATTAKPLLPTTVSPPPPSVVLTTKPPPLVTMKPTYLVVTSKPPSIVVTNKPSPVVITSKPPTSVVTAQPPVVVTSNTPPVITIKMPTPVTAQPPLPNPVPQQPPCVPCVIPPTCPVPQPCPVQCPVPCPPLTTPTAAPPPATSTLPPSTPAPPPQSTTTAQPITGTTKPPGPIVPSSKPPPPVTPPWTTTQKPKAQTTTVTTAIPPIFTTPKVPVNGNYTSWSSWTECTVTCGSGIQQRVRTCKNPQPKNGGKNCTSLGAAVETRPCNTQPCPTDGGYGNWSSFSPCSATCGGGEQIRTRECNNPVPQYNGKDCAWIGPANETRPCNTFYCPIDGNYSEWSEYMACSVTCGKGVQTRTRNCNSPPPQHGGKNCSELGPSSQLKECELPKCPIDGGYSPFTNWSDCTQTCGGGEQIRTRTCTNPPPQHGGRDCSHDGPDYEKRYCNTEKCPIDGGFTPFSNYSVCSKTCGGGIQTRMRSCSKPHPQFGGKNCSGNHKETRDCNMQPCPIDGGFDEWGNYSDCSLTCGGGTQTRMRTCTNPVPQNGGKPCSGETTQTKPCNTQACPVDGGYSPWSEFSQCSATCGGGISQRTRTCTSPSPGNGGKDCSSLGPTYESKNCSSNPCPINGGYSEWSQWSTCSVTCGGGSIKKTRNCTSPPPQYGGKDCSSAGPDLLTRGCNQDKCPVHGGYTPWSDWNPCTVTCGGGETIRIRQCTQPTPAFGGNECFGPSTEIVKCKTDSCPVNGGYSPWGQWSQCSVSCGNGQQFRYRNCSNPSPSNGGSDCQRLGEPTEQKKCFSQVCPPGPPDTGWSQCSKTCGGGIKFRMVSDHGEMVRKETPCNTLPCPVNGGFTNWSNWTECTVTCGGGLSSRTRSCTNPTPLFGGSSCSGEIVNTKECRMEPCPPPRIPIRSCREFMERCHSRSDGLYNIYLQKPNSARTVTAYCDMTHDDGGWTLLVTSASHNGWTVDNVKDRNSGEPSITKDYSILGEGDTVKAIAVSQYYLYRLEAGERGSNGAIFTAPQNYSFTSTSGALTGVQLLKSFGEGVDGPKGIGKRMPYISVDDDKSLLTTADCQNQERYGTIVSKVAEFNPAQWIGDGGENPGIIWYWLKESSTFLSAPSAGKPDPMCPSPVPGGYNEWSQWSPCTVTCGGGTQLRTRNCTNPAPQNGGGDCSQLGGNMESRKCHPEACPGVKVDGGYTEWSPWTECTASCGGGTRMRNRTCTNPPPQNEGKTCLDQGLGAELETQLCNVQPCPSVCTPPCQNGGTCVNAQCQCNNELYQGSHCETPVCKVPCQNGGTCVKPNHCSCTTGYKNKACSVPVCQNICQNGGTCVAPNKCQCQPGYSGQWCQISSCKPDCLNGGTCVNGNCVCPMGVSGPNCNIVSPCEIGKPEGPCQLDVQQEVDKAGVAEQVSPCIGFLKEVLNHCSYRNMSFLYSKKNCEQQCDPSETDVCQRVWNTDQCVNAETRYYFDPYTKQCAAFKFGLCLGNENIFYTLAECQDRCSGPKPTVVTPTGPGPKEPPVPASYYWYFLLLKENKIYGNPPFDIQGSRRLLNMGFLLTNDTSLYTTISSKDCLVDPEGCHMGFSIGMKMRLDLSLQFCQQQRYILDTGPSVGSRGVSVHIAGGILVAQVCTSKGIWKAQTPAAYDFWFYILITWSPDSGLQFYGNSNLKASAGSPQSSRSAASVYSGKPNFVLGRGLRDDPNRMCGLIYMNSLAVFKRYMKKEMAAKIFAFFWSNVVSKQPLKDYYIKMKIHNMSGKKIVLIPGDNDPASGMTVNVNMIAMITKDAPVGEPNVSPIQFAVVDADSRRQFLLINGSKIVTLIPLPNKNQEPINLFIGNPVSDQFLYLKMRIVNSAGVDVVLACSDNDPTGGFPIGKGLIVVIEKKVKSVLPIKFWAFAKDGQKKTPLFINSNSAMELTPVLKEDTPGVHLTITKTGSPVTFYFFNIRFANYASQNVTVMTEDGDPRRGFFVKSRTIVQITKKVTKRIPVTFWAKIGEKSCVLNNLPSLVLEPKEKDGEWQAVNITDHYVSPPTKPPTQQFSLILQLTNNAGSKVTLISSDSQPLNGIDIEPRGILAFCKQTDKPSSINFMAVDSATEKKLMINGLEDATVIPSNKQTVTPLLITAGAGVRPAMPMMTPSHFWSFYVITNGMITGKVGLKVNGKCQAVDGGLHFDGASGYLSSHLRHRDALVNPGDFLDGFTVGLKLKFPAEVLNYDHPAYVIDTGEKSVNSPGVSLYLLDKKLVFELATFDTRWKAEVDVKPGEWFYLGVAWRMRTGLAMYVNGKQMTADKGGVGVQNMKDWSGEENFFIGRNVGGSNQGFASFFIASFVVFDEYLEASAMYSVYKYYFSDVAVQPAKQYYINLLISNTENEDVLLTASDSQPDVGFRVMANEKDSRLLKRLKSPEPVRFQAWGVSTDKPFLINGQKEFVVSPSDYQQQVTDVSIRLVKPGDDLAPAPRYYLSFALKNQAGVYVRVGTSDNDPPEGYSLGPGGTCFVTKELSTPSDVSVHAVVPGNEKRLLINRLPTMIIKPRAWPTRPYLMRITGKQGDAAPDGGIVVTTPPVSSIYFWRLKTVTPQGFVEGNPAFTAHGKVSTSDGAVLLDGTDSFLTTDMSYTDCFEDPAQCLRGMSLGMNAKFDHSVLDYKDPRYLIDTGAQSLQTRGISLFFQGGNLTYLLAIENKLWRVISPVTLDKWTYLTLTWSETEGLSMYEDDKLLASDPDGQSIAARQVNTAQTNLCIGGRVPNVFSSDFAKFSVKSIALFDECISATQIGNVVSFYRDYDGSSAVETFYIVMEVTNLSKKKFALQSNDNYPAGGMEITPGAVVKIKKAVSRPSAVVFYAKENGTILPLLLNGHKYFSVSPAKSALQAVKVTVTQKGQPLSQPVIPAGTVQESSVSAPPVSPSLSWIFSAMHDNLVPGEPSLQVHGDLLPVLGGASFDGSGTYCDATLPHMACVVNPDLCAGGFATGAKMRFQDDALAANVPRYVMDTGASSNNKGIAVYLQLNNLYVKIVTSSAVYQASLPVVPNKWFYVIADFNRKTGLQLYVDGVLVSGDAHGVVGNHKASDLPQNLFIGSSSAHGGFGKFQLASLATFKGVLSPHTLSRVYSYFWRQGDEGESQKYYMTLVVKNNIGRKALLFVSDNSIPDGIPVGSDQTITIASSMKSRDRVFITAIDGPTGQMLFLDNVARLAVSPTQSPDEETEVSITQSGVINDEGATAEQTSVISDSPVTPFHSWPFSVEIQGKILGTPPLYLYGTTQIFDGAMSFDGASTYATAFLGKNDCLEVPGVCKNGLTLGTKVKFDQADMSYSEPKYLVDTGARSASTSGISMYVLNGNLFCELSTTTRAWKVQTQISPDQWYYAGLTWKNDRGLKLYMNGKEVASDDQGKEVSVLVNSKKPNLSFGRDVLGTGGHFAKFRIGSFSSFNTYLTASMMRAIYTFYFRSGDSETSSTSLIRLQVNNTYDGDVQLMSSDHEPHQGLQILKKYSMGVIKVVPRGQAITFTAKSSSGDLFLNNYPSVSLTPDLSRKAPFYVLVSKEKTGGTGGVSTTGTYFITMRIVNNSGKKIVLIPSDRKPSTGYTIRPDYALTFTKPTTGNEPVKFTAEDPTSGTLMKINGSDSVTLIPCETKEAPKAFEILFPGTKPGARKKLKNDHVINLEISKNIHAIFGITIPIGSGGGKQYYVSVLFKNRAGQDAVIEASDHNPKNGWKVKKNFMMAIKKGTESAQPIKLAAFTADGSHSPLSLNDSLSCTVVPSPIKDKRIVLNVGTQVAGKKKTTIPSYSGHLVEKPSTYFVTLKVRNRAGKKSIIAPSYKALNEGFHIGTGSIMKITREFQSSEPLLLRAFDPDSHSSMLINNRKSIIVKPAKFKDNVTDIVISLTNGTSGPVERYITLVLHDKVGREVRVIPSKGRKGGYVVKPNKYLKVSMVFPKSSVISDSITFEAQDLETMNILELNGDVNKVSVTPREFSDEVINMTITAPAPSVKPVHSWSMKAVKDSQTHNVHPLAAKKLSDSSIIFHARGQHSARASEIPGNPDLRTHGEITVVEDGLEFDGRDSHAVAQIPPDDCVINPENCPDGLSFGTKLKFDGLMSEDEPRYIIDTGAHTSSTRGVSLYTQQGKLVALVRIADREWMVHSDVLLNEWAYVMITWHKRDGLKLYYNAQLRSNNATGAPVENTTVNPLKENFVIGREVGNNGPFHPDRFNMASMTTFAGCLSQDDVNAAYIFFWSGLSAKIYYASLCVTNEVGRSIILKPDKGNPQGFPIVPDSTLEVTLMSMSTDGAPIKPVFFEAHDRETNISLKINDWNKPFPVTPTDGRKPCNSLVVTVPPPKLRYKKMWVLRKVENGRLVGDDPVPEAHGSIASVDGGLLLNGNDSWLDMGNYEGECLSNPDKCTTGLTFGLRFKLDDAASGYKDEPHYIVDSGGSNKESRGFTLFVKDGKLYAVVSVPDEVWRVESDLSSNAWQYVMVTWARETGIALYLNGTEVARSRGYMPQEGDHDKDAYTRLVVGRNAAGVPYGYTRMIVSTLEFFDAEVPAEDAKGVFLYFSSNVESASSNRFVKVRFDNKAGTQVKIIPNKGRSKTEGYTVQPHMTLDLSFEEKGQQNDIPIEFRAVNPWSPGDTMLLNGKKGPVVVSPSANKDAIRLVNITAAFRCLRPEGLFQDPTDKTRYVHCRKGEPHSMVCPDEMIWDDSRKTCFGEGRESSTNAPQYYFYIKFTNNAGKDAQIFIPGSKKSNAIPPGKSLSLKFSKSKSEPADFVALSNPYRVALLLDELPVLKITPSQNADKIVPVTITNPPYYYTIFTKTGNKYQAGTDGKVFVRLIGQSGSTDRLALSSDLPPGAKHFKTGQLDVFRVAASNIGLITKMFVELYNTGESKSWFLDKVSVKDANGRQFEFPVNTWIAASNGVQAQKELALSSEGFHDEPAKTPIKPGSPGLGSCLEACNHGGQCVEGQCICPLNYEGKSCENAICKLSCFNGGNCTDPSSNKCSCPPGYTGSLCQTSVCNNYCLHNGQCSEPESCTCPPGYRGKRCEISDCKPDCLNGGTCTADGTCDCPPGYSGSTCRIGSLCTLPPDNGPCLGEMANALSAANRRNITQACANYLTDIQGSCSVNNRTSNFAECENTCGENSHICVNVWKKNKCDTELLKFYFNPSTNQCQAFKYYSCLGNDNKFDDIKRCQEACSQHANARREISRGKRASKGSGLRTIVQRLHEIARQTMR